MKRVETHASTPFGNSCERGFSLVELLAVISIIVVLAAMLLPAIGVVRSAAQVSACASSLRQLQMANGAYANDWDGLYVPLTSYDPSGSTNESYYWYMNSTFKDSLDVMNPSGWNSLSSKLCCPLARALQPAPGPLIAYSTGYSVPKYAFSFIGTPNVSVCPKTAYPGISSKIAFVDALNMAVGYWYANPSPAFWSGYYLGGMPAPEGYGRGCVAYRHHGMVNAAFYDGHISKLTGNDCYQILNWQ